MNKDLKDYINERRKNVAKRVASGIEDYDRLAGHFEELAILEAYLDQETEEEKKAAKGRTDNILGIHFGIEPKPKEKAPETYEEELKEALSAFHRYYKELMEQSQENLVDEAIKMLGLEEVKEEPEISSLPNTHVVVINII